MKERAQFARTRKEEIESGEEEFGREYVILGVRCRDVYWIIREEDSPLIKERILIGIQTFDEVDGMWHYV